MAVLSNNAWERAKRSWWWRTIKLAWVRWKDSNGDQHAAAFSYYLLLSLLPLIILVVTAGSLLVERDVATQALVGVGGQHAVLTAEQKETAVKTIHGMLDARGEISLSAFPLLIWGALKFLRTLVRTTNRIWKLPPYNWWRLPLKGLGLLGITVSAAFFGIVLPGWAQLVRPWLASQLEIPEVALSLFFFLIPWLVLFYGLIMIYRIAPRRPTRFSEVWLGALGATVLIRLGERVFLIYASNVAQFNALYGALGGIVAFLLWLYLSSCVGVFGICFCAARADTRQNPSGHQEGPAKGGAGES